MDAITYMLMSSLKRHIEAIWYSDLYEYDSTQTRVGACPAALVDLFTYTDKAGVQRIFAPCSVTLGRLQEEALNLAKNVAIPSAYVEVVSNDYEEVESWRHTISRSSSENRSRIRDYPFMVGGEHGMTRRFIVKMITYFLESDQGVEEINRLGHAGCSFLESICTAHWEMGLDWNWKLLDENGVKIVDPFGERPWTAHAPISHTRVRGGPPTDYIFDTKVYVEVSSYRSNEAA